MPIGSATLTSKGEIAVPAVERTALGAGDRAEFVQVATGRHDVIAATRSMTALRGMFGRPRKTVSIDGMNAVIAKRGAAAR
ncbi:AbrB family transcriptional regulator [Accumulibacter sp.]|uniref:AbrB family transcriptional regulator n=1 Tax=Accumulibacter sp. TaxID=2053492 RepID=UPI0035ADD5C7